MFFAIAAALLLQAQPAPQISSPPADNIALIQAAVSATSDDAPVSDSPLPPDPVVPDAAADATVPPVVESSMADLPDALVPSQALNVPMALILSQPIKPMTVSVDELRAENRNKLRLWKGLAIASSGAATFDAWTTRHTLTTVPGSQELDPFLKPFAGNASMYVAVQVGPLLLDYLGKKMMYNNHSWARRIWWAPQTASFLGSFISGAHNLSVH